MVIILPIITICYLTKKNMFYKSDYFKNYNSYIVTVFFDLKDITLIKTERLFLLFVK